MKKNKIIMIQVWIGPIPEYFWSHYETTKNLKGFDFLFFTDQELFLDSSNYKVLKITKNELERLVSNCINQEIKIKSNKKVCDLKASYGDVFYDYIKEYDYFGIYDLDTLFGDVFNFTNDLFGKYDVISIADEIYHNRLSGPFLILRNEEKLRKEYLCEEFIRCFESEEVECFEETILNEKIRERYKIKLLYSINCETDNGGKNTYDCYWTGGKLYVKGKEKLLYHFYRKKYTKVSKVGNMIIANYNKVLLDDFYWVVSFTQNYEHLFKNLLKSIKKYSNRKCIIYSINYDYRLPTEDLTNEQFIVRRMNVPEGDKDGKGRDINIVNSKSLINYDVLQHFPDKKFVSIDSDIYFTVNSDEILNFFEELEYYPLINSHVNDVVDLSIPLYSLLEEIGHKNYVLPRRKTNVLIFDKRSEWFFIEQIELYQKYKGKKFGVLSLDDEDTANAILSKYGLRKCLPIVDIEDSIYLDLEKISNYNFSPSLEKPKNKNEILFFHGCKTKEYFDELEKNFGNSVLDCDEFFITYENSRIKFEKNSFFTTKTFKNLVNFLIYDSNGVLVFNLQHQEIRNYFLFFVDNLFLPNGKYTIKIVEAEDNFCIFKDILEIKNIEPTSIQNKKKKYLEDFYWVVHFSESYENLFHNLLTSIKKYSNRKVIIYSINYDYKIPSRYVNDEQVIIRRIDIPQGPKDSRGRDSRIMNSKPQILIDAIKSFPNKKFVHIDTDIYLTVNSDDISKYIKDLENYPLANSHIHDVIYMNNIVPNEEWSSSLHILLNEEKIDNPPIFPRRKCNVILFDERSLWFFEEQMQMYHKYKDSGIPGVLAVFDEDTFNTILHKYQFKKTLPLLDIEEVNEVDMEMFHKYSYHMTPISQFVVLPKSENEVLFFHGIKSQKHYDLIKENYDPKKLDYEDISLNYKKNTVCLEKTNTKNVPEKLNLEILDDKDFLICSFTEQYFKNNSYLYFHNIELPKGIFTVKLLDSSTGVCIFKNILEVV